MKKVRLVCGGSRRAGGTGGTGGIVRGPRKFAVRRPSSLNFIQALSRVALCDEGVTRSVPAGSPARGDDYERGKLRRLTLCAPPCSGSPHELSGSCRRAQAWVQQMEPGEENAIPRRELAGERQVAAKLEELAVESSCVSCARLGAGVIVWTSGQSTILCKGGRA